MCIDFQCTTNKRQRNRSRCHGNKQSCVKMTRSPILIKGNGCHKKIQEQRSGLHHFRRKGKQSHQRQVPTSTSMTHSGIEKCNYRQNEINEDLRIFHAAKVNKTKTTLPHSLQHTKCKKYDSIQRKEKNLLSLDRRFLLFFKLIAVLFNHSRLLLRPQFPKFHW